MSKKNWLFSIVLLLALILAACAPAASPQTQAPEATQPPAVAQPTEAIQPTEAMQPTEPPPAAQPSETPAQAERKVATFIWTQEFDSLNPYYTNMWFSGITQQLWDSWAWDFDDENNPLPVLVTEIPSTDNGGISADGTVITMHLRDDIKWSDGEPLTSADFKFTYDMVTNPANAVTSVTPYDLLASLETPDDRTVVMTFKEPYAPWLGALWHGLLPQHVLQTVFDADGTIDNADWNRKPTVGAGPYVFAEWESGSYARFVANDNYWGPKPKIDEIFFRFVPDDASQVAALKTGDGDLGTFISYADIPALKDAGVQIFTVFSGYNEGWYMYLDPKNGHPALQDVNVRKAIAMAFDRQKINDDLLLGLTKPAVTYWDNTPYADPSLTAYPFDPEQAKKLLDDAGWVDSNGDGVRDKDGVDLELTYGTTTREIRQDTQAVAQQQLADVGVKLDLSNYDSDIFFSGYAEGGPAATGQLDIMEWSDTTQFPDPEVAYWLCSEIPSADSPSGTNWQAICDPELDQLFQQEAKQVDFAARQQTFYKISKMIFDKVYWLGLWQDPDIWAVGSRLQNVKISGATPFFNIAEWDLK
jgi:peptide/nickel transport system substrate-binding protein